MAISSPVGQGDATTPQNTTLLRLDHHELQRLHEFHAAHFPGQEVPKIDGANDALDNVPNQEVEDSDHLGYYEDGVRRTLTDEQIRMFRHSEIQRLLLARRQISKREEQEAPPESKKQQRIAPQRHFDDDAVQQQEQIDTLMYDDEGPNRSNTTTAVDKQFLWPKLGG